MVIPWIQLGIGALGTAFSATEARKQRRAMRAELARQREERSAALADIRTTEQRQLQPIEAELNRARLTRSARDPFLEAGINQAAQEQVGAAQGQLRATGAPQQLSLARRAAGAQAQSLLARESMRLQREREMTGLIASGLQQTAGIRGMALKSRQEVEADYGSRISGLRSAISSQPNVWRSAISGGASALLGGLVKEGMEDFSTSVGEANKSFSEMLFGGGDPAAPPSHMDFSTPPLIGYNPPGYQGPGGLSGLSGYSGVAQDLWRRWQASRGR